MKKENVVLSVLLAVIVGTGVFWSITATPQADSSPVSTRIYLLSSAGVQAYPGQEFLYQITQPPAYTMAQLAKDVDVLTLHVEFYGLPWSEFAASTTPPENHPWTKAINKLATEAKATGKPISLQMVLARDVLAGNALDNNGVLKVDTSWAPQCYNFATAPDGAQNSIAYQNYVKWMTQKFAPQFVNVGVEINKFYEGCGAGAGWNALAQVETAAYASAKSAKASSIVFISVVIEDIYNKTLTGFDNTKYVALANFKRDRFGISSYPQGLQKPDGSYISASDLPSDYFTRVRVKNPLEQKVVIAETGWNSDTMGLGTPTSCITTLVPSSEQKQADYLDFLLKNAQTNKIGFVTWWSNRDLLPLNVMTGCYPSATFPSFPECSGDSWCVVNNVFRSTFFDLYTGDVIFKAFGTMGIRRYDGTAKTVTFQRWQQALKTRILR